MMTRYSDLLFWGHPVYGQSHCNTT